MTDFLQLTFSGLSVGAIYALVAIGFTLLWQTSGSINFAQGEFVMLPAFFMLTGLKLFGFGLAPAFVMAVGVSIILQGAAYKRGVVDQMLKHGVLPMVVASLGLSIALKNIVKATVSAEAQPFPAVFPDHVFNILGVTITLADLGTIAVATLVIGALWWMLNRTLTGQAMQAVAQNRDTAAVLGIDVERMVLYAFAANAALAAVAALLVTPSYLAKFDMGDGLGMKAFFAAIIGGFNQVQGAMLGGLLVGVLENLAAAYISPAYKDAIALVLFIGVILVKPEGLLGKQESRKV
jgi:branched-chain amino acid transport system permease protein